jgi:hypothetical protein
MSKYTPQMRRFLRVLARDEGGDAAYARRMLIEDGQDWTQRITADNARINSARSNEDINAARFPTLFAAPKPRTIINRSPTKVGAAALLRAKRRKTP